MDSTKLQPSLCKPLRLPSCLPVAKSRPRKRKSRSISHVLSSCQWPGCSSVVEEKRLGSDMLPYSRNDFEMRFGTHCERYWNDAPVAAAYCPDHIVAKCQALMGMGLPRRVAAKMANSRQLWLHPESDDAALVRMRAWLAESKDLFALAYPHESQTSDMSLTISQLYCVSNKVSTHIGADGISVSHRRTYNPMNRAGKPAQNRKLLLHGTDFENVGQILRNDLAMSGCEIPSSSGRMLSEGLYLAESFMKALNYATVGEVNGADTKVVFAVEVNMGLPLVCKRVLFSSENVYEEHSEGTSRKDITLARGKYFFQDVVEMESGWACGCRVPSTVSKVPSASACIMELPSLGSAPLMFNEWCVHNTQLYKIKYVIVLKRAPRQTTPLSMPLALPSAPLSSAVSPVLLLSPKPTAGPVAPVPKTTAKLTPAQAASVGPGSTSKCIVM